MSVSQQQVVQHEAGGAQGSSWAGDTSASGMVASGSSSSRLVGMLHVIWRVPAWDTVTKSALIACPPMAARAPPPLASSGSWLA
jgi:hypothetical protein